MSPCVVSVKSITGMLPLMCRSLVVHGFAMDEDGRKMSKSEGNVVDPHTIINGGKVSMTCGQILTSRFLMNFSLKR